MSVKSFCKNVTDCLFSIKYVESNNNFYKVVTFFGFKFKFKNLNKKLEFIESKLADIIKNAKTYENEEKNLKNDLFNLEKEFSIFKNWQLNFYKDFPGDFPQSLSELEKKTLSKYYANSSNYLEFGSGGSTFIALNNPNLIINSVESDKNWLDYILSYAFLNNAHKTNRLKFHYIDIGKTKRWGYPVDDSQKNNYPNYSSAVFDNFQKEKIDLVFIDGRFRVACALATILNCSKDVIIMIHDYADRKDYHILEKFLDKIEIIDTLAIFKIKDNVEFAEVEKCYNEYKYTLL